MLSSLWYRASKMALQTHLVEHVSMDPDGISAKTTALAANLAVDARFSNHAEFAAALQSVEQEVQAHPTDDHLVVVCTHGIEDTGTWLHFDDAREDQRPEEVPHNLLNVRGSIVVYMAVCWGGYAGVIRRFHHGSQPWPTVVGALAPLTATEGNELQDAIISVLLASGRNEQVLGQQVSNFNSKYGTEYGHPVARIATSTGQWDPRQGTAGIAWSLLRDEDDRPIEGPFDVSGVDSKSGRVTVTCGEVNAIMAGGRLRIAKGSPPGVGDQFRFKSKISPCGRYLQIVGDATPQP